MKPSQTVLTTIFLLVAGVLTASIFFIYSTGTAAGSARQQVVSEISILNHLGQVISTLKDAETGQRGYLLTGQESYLQPYQTAVASFTAELDGIRKLATNGNVLASSFDNFDRLSKEKMAELAQTIQIRREQGFDAALAVVNSGQGKRTMDDLRAEMEKMMAAEREKLSQANRTADLASLRGTIAALIAGFFGLGITAVCYRRIGDEMKIREQNAVEIARQ